MGRHRVKPVKFPVENYRYESWAVSATQCLNICAEDLRVYCPLVQ